MTSSVCPVVQWTWIILWDAVVLLSNLLENICTSDCAKNKKNVKVTKTHFLHCCTWRQTHTLLFFFYPDTWTALSRLCLWIKHQGPVSAIEETHSSTTLQPLQMWHMRGLCKGFHLAQRPRYERKTSYVCPASEIKRDGTMGALGLSVRTDEEETGSFKQSCL